MAPKNNKEIHQTILKTTTHSTYQKKILHLSPKQKKKHPSKSPESIEKNNDKNTEPEFAIRGARAGAARHAIGFPRGRASRGTRRPAWLHIGDKYAGEAPRACREIIFAAPSLFARRVAAPATGGGSYRRDCARCPGFCVN